MERIVFIIPKNNCKVNPNRLNALTEDINQVFGKVERVRYMIGEMVEKPNLLLASIEAVRNKEDSEVCLVFDRQEKQIYASPEAMDDICQALMENTDPDATSWDVLDKVIPHEDAD